MDKQQVVRKLRMNINMFDYVHLSKHNQELLDEMKKDLKWLEELEKKEQDVAKY